MKTLFTLRVWGADTTLKKNSTHWERYSEALAVVVFLTYGSSHRAPVLFLKSFKAAWVTNNRHEAQTWNSEEVSGSTRQKKH